jgi:LmbE family N-acetylglucosaminyl deacetylase
MKAKKNLLIIEAHSDDSAISASGFLEKFKNKYEINFLLVCASDLNLNHYGFITREKRLEEYKSYVEHFKGRWHRTDGFPLDADGKLDTVPRREIVSVIENTINIVKPEIIIVQGPSFHHDHTIVYESTIAATRPTARHYPKELYLMENPTYVHSIGPSTDFKPDLYISLEEIDMQYKLELFAKCFPSQVREKSNYLSLEGIRAWSRYRGIEARCLYAEAYKTYQRII